MKKLKHIKLFEMFNPQFGGGYRPEGYNGDEWYKKMREYEQYISSIKKEASDIDNLYKMLPEELLKASGVVDAHDIRKKDSNTYGALKPDSIAMIYFDLLDESKENEIIEKAREIKEYSKIGHDPAWIISMKSRLGELSHQMFAFREEGVYRENNYGSAFWDVEKNNYVPYKYKKSILKERPF
jgi:hypothetical protein